MVFDDGGRGVGSIRAGTQLAFLKGSFATVTSRISSEALLLLLLLLLSWCIVCSKIYNLKIQHRLLSLLY